jgi:hypothetical protein
MEKFYIVTNADFLNEIKDYNVHDEERRKLINEFFDEKKNCRTRISYRRKWILQ